MASTRARPLSPHLTIWRWGPHMLVSILHRVTGGAMAIGGIIIFLWWIASAASGREGYEVFYRWVVDAGLQGGPAAIVNVLARLVAIGLTWAFFQHMATGVRHLWLDTGAGYELRRNKRAAIGTMLFSVGVTAALWLYVFLR